MNKSAFAIQFHVQVTHSNEDNKKIAKNPQSNPPTKLKQSNRMQQQNPHLNIEPIFLYRLDLEVERNERKNKALQILQPHTTRTHYYKQAKTHLRV